MRVQRTMWHSLPMLRPHVPSRGDAVHRGLIRGLGQPDEARAARILLKDYQSVSPPGSQELLDVAVFSLGCFACSV